MAWNEPGGNGNKDPWGHRKQEQGPPDLDELLQKMQDKVNTLFGGKNNNSGKKADKENGGGGEELSWSAIGFLIAIALIIWSLFGFYIVQPAEFGVVTQFGHYKETTEQGLNWHLPYPIEEVQKVNVEQVLAINHRALMLTKDENIVVIELIVQYRIKNAENYLFKVKNPEDTLHQATESALREIVGTSKMDAVLTSERARVAIDTKALIQTIVDRYKVGLKVTSVNMQNAQPPQAVQAAFADVIKAREDQERSKNKADAYANVIIEKANGISDKLRLDALAYKAQIVSKAEGETRRFLSVLKEYERAPAITRQRLYLDTMESVLSKTSKVMVDIQSGNNLTVLPLGQLLGKTIEDSSTAVPTTTPKSPSLTPSDIRSGDQRSRGGR